MNAYRPKITPGDVFQAAAAMGSFVLSVFMIFARA